MDKLKVSRYLIVFLTSFVALVIGTDLAAQSTKRGIITGGALHTALDWFKESFLEIQEDVDEASEANKHVMLFFPLNGCSYCDRMLTESFESEPVSSYIQQHFDVIAINVKGDREIAFNEEITVLEKELSEIVKVRATPAILFLDSQNRSILRADGYRAPERFQKILEYVSSRSYQRVSLVDYLDKSSKQVVYQLRQNTLFKPITDLSKVKGPLAVIFEDTSCYDSMNFTIDCFRTKT